MPNKRKYRKRKRKFRKFRKRRRKNKYNSISSMRVRGVSVIPDRLFCKLKYATSIVQSAVGVNTYIFRGNSLFDPDLTGVGHQPKGFDEWSALYSRYKVHGSKLTLSVSSSDANNNMAALIPMIESTPQFTLVDDLRETPYVKYRYIQGNGFSTSNVENATSISTYMSTKSIRGERILDDDYSALITANPNKLWHWHVLGTPMIETNAPFLQFIITITYHCEFFRRKALQQS